MSRPSVSSLTCAKSEAIGTKPFSPFAAGFGRPKGKIDRENRHSGDLTGSHFGSGWAAHDALSAYAGFVAFSARIGIERNGCFGSRAVDCERLEWAESGPFAPILHS
jgi:hypothetical protein